MKYMLLVYLDEQALSDAEREHCYVESAQFAQDLNSSGQYLDASPLHPVSTATSVRVRDGKRVVTDGPFAETREQLGETVEQLAAKADVKGRMRAKAAQLTGQAKSKAAHSLPARLHQMQQTRKRCKGRLREEVGVLLAGP